MSGQIRRVLGVVLVLFGISLAIFTSFYVEPFLRAPISEAGAGFYGAIFAGYPIALASIQAGRLLITRKSDAFDVVATESRAELIKQFAELSIGGDVSVSQTFRSEADGSTKSVQDVAALLGGVNANIVLLGAAGAGKSYSSTAIAIELATHGPTISLVVPATQWDPSRTASDWVISYGQRKLSISKATFLDWVATRRLVLIFDGLDELAVPCANKSDAEATSPLADSGAGGSGTRVDRCEAFLSALMNWRIGTIRVPFLVACRSEIWLLMDPELTADGRLARFALRVPTIDAVKLYLTDVLAATTVDASFVDDLIRRIDVSDRRRYLKSCWSVAMLACVARDVVQRAGQTDEAATEATNIVAADELLHRFVELALVGRNRYLDRLLAAPLRDALASFASHMGSTSRDAAPEEAIGTRSDLFLHRLWPAYGPISTRATDLVLCMLLSLPGFLWLFAFFWPRGTVAEAACLAFSAVWIAMLVRTSTRAWVRPAKFDRTTIFRPQRLVRQTAAAAAVGLLAGYLVSFGVGVGAFATAWLVVGFTVGFGQTLTTDSQAQVSGATSTLRYEHWVSRVCAIIVLPLLVTGFYASWAIPGAAIAIMYCAVVGESVASALWRRHVATSIVALLTLRLPPGFVLRRSKQLGLIRSAGLAYQFRHDTVRAWFLNEALRRG